MSRDQLEQRVSALEKQLGVLLAGGVAAVRDKDWRRTRGAFAGDELMKQVFAEGRKVRDAEREGDLPRKSKKRQARS